MAKSIQEYNKQYETLRNELFVIGNFDEVTILGQSERISIILFCSRMRDLSTYYPVSIFTLFGWSRDFFIGSMRTLQGDILGNKSASWVYKNMEQVIKDFMQFGGYLGERK